MTGKAKQGSGEKDRKLAGSMAKARGQAAKDRAARAGGHRSAGAARQWLQGRSK